MSPIDETELKRHVKNTDTWMRLAYLIIFCVAFYLTIGITFVVTIFQFLTKLFSGSCFETVTEFGENLSAYQAQVTRYLTFACDDKPFPFAPLPSRKGGGMPVILP